MSNRTRPASEWLPVLLLALLLTPGCRSAADRASFALEAARNASSDPPSVEGRISFKLGVDDELLDRLELDTLEATPRFAVACEPSLEDVSTEVTRRLDAALEQALGEVGLAETFPARLVFLSSEYPPHSLEFKSEAFNLPLLVTPGASADQVLRDNAPLIIMIAHEVAEATLIYPQHPPFLLADITDGNGRLLLAGDTRWFRDGFAHYVALRTGVHIAEADGIPLAEALGTLFADQPVMTALQRRSGGLRTWRNVEERSDVTADYAAALGAFLRLRSEFGSGAIPGWIKDLTRTDDEGRPEPITGIELAATFAARFGVSLQTWLDRATGGNTVPRAWRSPPAISVTRGDGLRWGVLVRASVDDGSEAEQEAPDFTFITAINGRPISTILEFECLTAGLTFPTGGD